MEYNLNLGNMNRLENLIKQYIGRMDDVFDDVKKQVTHYQYGTGDEFVHLGFYCPSIIADKVYGNVNRGKILKSKSPKRFSFKYGLDDNDKVLTVEGAFFKEFVMSDGNSQIGIRFCKNDTSYLISSSEYDEEGRIKAYRELGYISLLKKILYYKDETYKYNEKILNVLETRVDLDFYRISNHTLVQEDGIWYPVEYKQIDAGKRADRQTGDGSVSDSQIHKNDKE